MKKTICMLAMAALLHTLNFCTQAQNTYPPALGPFNVEENDPGMSPLQGSLVTTALNSVLNETVLLTVNQQLPEHVSIGYSIRQLKPRLSQTRNMNMPNEKFVEMGYTVEYAVKLKSVVLRRLSHTISVRVFCNDWSNPAGGRLDIKAFAPTPGLLEPSLAEQVLNLPTHVFTNGRFTLSESISNIIKSYLPDAITRRIDLPGFNYRFNCLNVSAGLKDGYGLYQDAIIMIKMKPIPSGVEFKGLTIKLIKIKRLNARSNSNEILYKPSEDMYVSLFANSEELSFQFDNFMEGQERTFPDNKIMIFNPLDYKKLVVIAQINQSDMFAEDAAFEMYNAAENFGNGRRKIIVTKPFVIPAHQSEAGWVKPQTSYDDAYEITYEIVSRVNTPASQVNPGAQ